MMPARACPAAFVLKCIVSGGSMSLGGWLAQQAVSTASQGLLLWSARTECPPCHCSPSLICGSGQEALQLACPPGGWQLSAVLLALLSGLVVGATAARFFTPAELARPLTGAERLEEEARAQAALGRARALGQ